MTATISLKKNQRGFVFGKFADAKGTLCSIQESSLATEYAIWFGVTDVNPQILKDGKLVPVPPPVEPIPIVGFPGLTHDIAFNDRMHLTIEDVQVLVEEFQKYLTTKKCKTRRFKDRYNNDCSIRLTEGLIELGCDNANPQICSNGWHPVAYPKGTIFTTHMFLGVAEVMELKPLLDRFLETGRVGE